jgi:hypothetical protein
VDAHRSAENTRKVIKNRARRALTALLENPDGHPETQLATTVALPIEKVHRLIDELALDGIVNHEDSPMGHLVRLNSHNEKAAALRILLRTTEPGRAARISPNISGWRAWTSMSP